MAWVCLKSSEHCLSKLRRLNISPCIFNSVWESLGASAPPPLTTRHKSYSRSLDRQKNSGEMKHGIRLSSRFFFSLLILKFWRSLAFPCDGAEAAIETKTEQKKEKCEPVRIFTGGSSVYINVETMWPPRLGWFYRIKLSRVYTLLLILHLDFTRGTGFPSGLGCIFFVMPPSRQRW